MKTFKHFIYDTQISQYNIMLDEQKRNKKKDIKRRMSDAFDKKEREKKVQKLLDNPDHWRRLS